MRPLQFPLSNLLLVEFERPVALFQRLIDVMQGGNAMAAKVMRGMLQIALRFLQVMDGGPDLRMPLHLFMPLALKMLHFHGILVLRGGGKAQGTG